MPALPLLLIVILNSLSFSISQTFEAILEVNPFCNSTVTDGQGYMRVFLGPNDGQYNLTFSGVDMVNMAHFHHDNDKGKGNFTQIGTLLDLLQTKAAGVSGNVTVTNKFNAKILGPPFDKKKKPPSMAALVKLLDSGRVWVGVHKKDVPSSCLRGYVQRAPDEGSVRT
eukprot:jgi/Botrbrau1/17041/Bobra.49_2s0097.1